MSWGLFIGYVPQRGVGEDSPWYYNKVRAYQLKSITDGREEFKYHPNWYYIIYEWLRIQSFFLSLAPPKLYLIKRREHTVYLHKFLPPLGSEPGSCEAVSRWLIHYAVMPHRIQSFMIVAINPKNWFYIHPSNNPSVPNFTRLQ